MNIVLTVEYISQSQSPLICLAYSSTLYVYVYVYFKLLIAAPK